MTAVFDPSAFSRDWAEARARFVDAAIQAAIRDHFYPPHDGWKERVLFRSWQVWRQALAGLAAS